MNCNCYKVIFSKRLGTLVAVGEHTSSTGKAASGQASRGGLAHASFVANGFVGALRLSFASVALACLSLGGVQAQTTRPAPASNALPSGGTLNTGSATISTSGAQMAINQTSDKASINWNSFNIGSSASVNIAQPNASSVLLNRVVGQDPSQIFGKLSANGQVILLNPNGIVFGRDGSVTASSFTASTFNLTDADFMSGFYKYNRNGSNAAIVNEGTIETSAGGFVTLIGASVTNDGKIIARQGNVVMVAAESVTLPDTLTSTTAPSPGISVPLSRKVRLELSPAAVNAAVNNTQGGVIVTEGGQVLLQAAALSSAVASVTHSGSIDASGTQGGAVQVLADNGNIRVDGSVKSNSTGNTDGQNNRGGDIIIGRDEDTGALARTTDVSGAKLESIQGFVETSGHYLKSENVSIAAGEWLLDPVNVEINATSTANSAGNSVVLSGDINAALNLGTSVTIRTGTGAGSTASATGVSLATTGATQGTGTITLNDDISKSSGGTASLNLLANSDIYISAGKKINSNTGALNVLLNSNMGGTGGIYLATGAGIASNGGNVTLAGGAAGTGASSTNASAGHGISLSGASINAGAGTVTLNGTSATTGTSIFGVNLDSGATITTTTGNVSITGKSMTSGQYGFGMMIQGVGTKVTTGSGNITVNATSTASGSSDAAGIQVRSAGALTTTSGNISLTGTSLGSTGTANLGIDLNGASLVAGSTGTVTLIGTGVNGCGVCNASVTTTGATVSITGTTTSGTADIVSKTSNINTSGGNISFIGNSYVGDVSEAINAGSGTVTFQNRTSGTLVNVGGADVIAGSPSTLGVSNAELNRITAANTRIGSTTAGNLTVSTAITTLAATGNLYLQTNGTATVNASSAVSSAAGLFIQTTGGNITTNSAISGTNIALDNTNGTIATATGAITKGASAGAVGINGIDLYANVTASGNLNLYGLTNSWTGIKVQPNVTLSGRNIQATGTTGATTGIYFDAGSNVTTTGTSGASLLTGNSASTTSGGGQAAVSFWGNTLTAAAGTTLAIIGNATGSSAAHYTYTRGLRVDGTVNTYGAVSLTGNSSSDDGLLVQAGGINIKTGSLTLSGTMTANGANSGQTGLAVSQPITLSNGTSLTITGKAANQSSAISFAETGVAINNTIGQAAGQTTAGNISITGYSSSYGNSNGVNIASAVSTGSGNITLIGQRLAGGNGAAFKSSANITSTTGSITIQGIGGSVSQNSGTISGANITIDNTGAGLTSLISDNTGGPNLSVGTSMGGSINGSGVITAGSGVNVWANAVTVSGTLTTPGNLNIQGNVSTSSYSGVSISGTGVVTATGTNSNNNIGANYNLINAGAVSTTGTSSAISLRSSLGNVNGAGTIAGGGLSITIDSATAGTISGLISGTGALSKAGSGTTTLSRNETYSGGTNVNAGTLQIGSGSTTGTLGSGAVAIASNANLSFYRSDTALNVSNAISGAGNINFLGTGIQGESDYRLSGNNSSFSGNINLTSSRLGITAANQLGTAAIMVNSGAGLYLNGGFTVNNALSLAGNGWNETPWGYLGALRLQSSANYGGVITLTSDARIGAHNGIGSISGVITGSSNVEFNTPADATSSTISLTNANTYTGSTTISSGTLNIGTGSTSGSMTATSAITNNGSLIINRSDALTLSQNISGSGSLTQAGSGITTLLGTNSYGATNINAGTLQIGNGGTTGTLGTGAVVNNSTLKLNRSTALAITNAISGTGGITQLGSGTSTLSGNNTYTGATNVNAGTLQAGSLTAFGNGDLVTVSSGATVDVAGFAVTNPFSLNGAGVASLGALVNTGAADTLTGAITLTGDTSIGGTGELTLSNAVVGAYGLNVIDTGSFTATNTSNNISKLAANGVSDLNFLNSSALEIGSVNSINGITSTGQVAITTASGNLTVSQDISTTSTSTSAILLNAGQTASAGTATGGNIVLSGTRAFSTGANGRATLMTGSIADSTGMSALLNGLDHSRYNSDESNTNYSAALGSGVYGVYREQPTATITANSEIKTYDSIAYVGGNGVSASNLKNGDTNAGLIGTLTYAGSSQSAVNVGTYTLTASGQTSALGYALTYADGSLTINPKTLTLTAASVSKSYDGGLTYTTQNSDLFALSNQLVGNDTVSFASISFTNKNAATNTKTVTLDSVVISDGNGGNNYNITLAGNNTSTITPKAVTLSAASISKVYDGDVSYTTQPNELTALTSQLITGDSVTAATISYANKNAATGTKVVTLDSVTINDGNNGGNYTISLAGNNTSTITAKALTLTAAAVSKNYDGGTSYSTQASDIAALTSQLFTGDAVTSATISFADKNAATGSKVVTLDSVAINDGNNGGNYTITRVGNSTSTITPKTLTLTAASVSKTYDGGTTYITQAGDIAALTSQLFTGDAVTSATISFADKNAAAGSKVVTLDSVAINDGNSGGNYSITRAGNNASTITPKAVTLTAAAVSKTYDGGTTYATQAGDLTDLSNQLITGDAVTSATISFGDKNAAAGSKVVTLDSVAINDGNNGGNYTITRVGNNTSTIDKVSLNASLQGTVSKQYDSTTSADLASNNFAITGWISGEGATVTQTHGVYTSANVSSNGGTGFVSTVLNNSQFTATGITNLDNYILPNSASGNVGEITTKALSISGATVATKTYDGTASAVLLSNGNLTSLVGNETLVLLGLNASFVDANAGTRKIVGLSASLADGTNGGLASNYSLLNASTTGDITQKVLTLSGTTVANKVYDGNTNATVTSLGTLSGFVGNEIVLLSSVTGAFATALPGNNLAVALHANLQNGTNGGLANNYNVGVTTVQADITASSNGASTDTTPKSPVIPRPPVIPMSGSGSSGGGSGGGTSTGNPYIALPKGNASADRCTPNNLESCLCETQSSDIEVAICYVPKRTAQIAPSTKPRRS